MIQKRKKRSASPGTPGSTSQSAGVWYDIKSELPPFYKVICLKTKSGKVLNDCARIPNCITNEDIYIHGIDEYGNPKDIVEWMLPIPAEIKPYVNKKNK